ncbi:MAG: hypothetical protein NC078_06580 [Ruminococcus sp.]|nr:hypothetical protein [Ruminococcus sp.]
MHNEDKPPECFMADEYEADGLCWTEVFVAVCRTGRVWGGYETGHT